MSDSDATAVSTEATKRKPLKKPTGSKLKKVKARVKSQKRSKKRKTVKRAAARTRVDVTAKYRVAKKVDPEKIRSKILLTMVKVGKRLKTFDAERLNKAVGKHLPTKSKDRQRAVISWRLRHSGLFIAA